MPSRYFRLEISNLGVEEWEGRAPDSTTAFPPHVLNQILAFLPASDRVTGFLNLLRLCGRTRKTNLR